MFSTQSWIACWEGLSPWQKTSIKWLFARLSLNLSCLIYGGLQVFQEITRYPRYLPDTIPDYTDSHIGQQATHFCTVLYTLACFEIQFKTLKSVSVCFKRDSQIYFYPKVVPTVLCSSYSITIYKTARRMFLWHKPCLSYLYMYVPQKVHVKTCTSDPAQFTS